ncbi:MAG: efflux RND transporter periplasmic adaptor subunit [Acidobacteriota bacterium]
MKKVILISSVVILIAVIVYFSVFYGREGQGKEVYAFKAERGDIVSSVFASGRIEPKTKVNVSSNVIGEIKEIGIREGDRVKKGNFLVQLDKERYLSEVEKLEAYQRMSRITLEKEKVNLENYENTFRRVQALYNERIISEDVLEEAKLRLDTQKIYLKSLDEQVLQAEADLEKARDELNKTRITSPMDGLVTQLNAEVGEQALAGTINIPGTVIMVISDMSEVLAGVDVDETEVVSVKKGQEARIKVDAIGDKYEFQGIVEEIGNTAVKKGEINVFPVKIRITNPDERLKPGMTARASIETDKSEGVIKIPIQGVVSRNVEKEKEKARERTEKEKKRGKKEGTEQSDKAEGKPVEGLTTQLDRQSATEKKDSGKGGKDEERDAVYLMVEGKAILVPVEVGISDEFFVEIKSGVKEGDMVVTGPYRTLKNLKEGDKIKEKKEEEEAEKDKKEEKASEVEVKVED